MRIEVALHAMVQPIGKQLSQHDQPDELLAPGKHDRNLSSAAEGLQAVERDAEARHVGCSRRAFCGFQDGRRRRVISDPVQRHMQAVRRDCRSPQAKLVLQARNAGLGVEIGQDGEKHIVHAFSIALPGRRVQQPDT